jgi:hypothetical protein
MQFWGSVIAACGLGGYLTTAKEPLLIQKVVRDCVPLIGPFFCFVLGQFLQKRNSPWLVNDVAHNVDVRLIFTALTVVVNCVCLYWFVWRTGGSTAIAAPIFFLVPHAAALFLRETPLVFVFWLVLAGTSVAYALLHLEKWTYPRFSKRDFIDPSSLFTKLTQPGPNDQVSRYLFSVLTTQSPKAASTFSEDELIGLRSLAEVLKKPARPVDTWLKSQLEPDTCTALRDYPREGADTAILSKALVRDLNLLVWGPSIYEERRFSGVTLRPETTALRSQGGAPDRLNRMLIEDAYPQAVRTSRLGNDSNWSSIPTRERKTWLKSLKKDLNNIIKGASICAQERFLGITLRPDTQQLSKMNPVGKAAHLLNRLLLEDAYPDEFSRQQSIAIDLPARSRERGLAVLERLARERVRAGVEVAVLVGTLLVTTLFALNDHDWLPSHRDATGKQGVSRSEVGQRVRPLPGRSAPPSTI